MDLTRMGVRAVAAVMLGWLAVIGAVNLAVPQLESVIAKSSTPFVPADASSMRAFAQMDKAFGTDGSKSMVFVVAERPGGLTTADRRYLGDLAPRLGKSKAVSYVQDVRGSKALLDALTSEDKEAAYVQVGMPGDVGAPASIKQLDRVRALVATERPAGLRTEVTGPAATIADMAVALERSMLRITVVTVGLIGVILFVLYRRLSVVAVVLGFIGLALAAGRGAVALAGELGLFQVSTFTVSFLTAVLLGAATDYAVFLVSRYQELRRDGVPHRTAVTRASRRVGSVVIGSALTVIVATSTMLLAHIGLFNTTGPAVAVAVAVALLMSLTLLPVVILVVGARGWLDPRPRSAGGGWSERASAWTLARPGRALVAGLIPLLVLAAFVTGMRPSYDDRAMQPADSESNQGYRTLAAHFPPNVVLAEYVVVHADHDLRNPQDLAALEQAAASVSRVPGVQSVRTITRPLGKPLEQASVSYQAGQVGDRLGGATQRLAGGEKDAARLADGADQLEDGTAKLADGSAKLADGADRVAGGTTKAQAGAGKLVYGSRQLRAGIKALASGSADARSGADQLQTGAGKLAAGLESGHRDAQKAVDGLAQVQQALESSPTCGLDPYCRRARDGVGQIYAAERDQLLPGMKTAASGARSLQSGAGDLSDGLGRLDDGLATAQSGAGEIVSGQELMQQQLGRLAGGADQVAGAARQVAGGSQDVADGTSEVAGGAGRLSAAVTQLRAGLDQASTYLKDTSTQAKGPAMGGFYLPPSALKDKRLAAVSGVYVARDGRTARLIVIGGSNPFGHAAIARSDEVVRAAQQGLHGTGLADSSVATTGFSSIYSDIGELEQKDFQMVAAATLLAVAIILMLLTRSVVAALLLLVAVALSYATALGLGVLVWQVVLDKPIEWGVPAIAFVLLVSVGADYNLLLIKRVHDESPDGDRGGLARAVSASGRVIAAAGMIFAASMFSLMTGEVRILGQLGFIVGSGLLIDTFVVRTLVVPAIAAMLGRHLWWPGGRAGSPSGSQRGDDAVVVGVHDRGGAVA